MSTINTKRDKVATKDNKMKDSYYYYQNLRNQGSKRWTIPMDKSEHLDVAIETATALVDELKAIQKQRIKSYLKLFHARHAIDEASQRTKLLANGNDDTKHRSYKGAV